MTKVEEFLIKKINELDGNVRESKRYKNLRDADFDTQQYDLIKKDYELEVERWINEVRQGIDSIGNKE